MMEAGGWSMQPELPSLQCTKVISLWEKKGGGVGGCGFIIGAAVY